MLRKTAPEWRIWTRNSAAGRPGDFLKGLALAQPPFQVSGPPRDSPPAAIAAPDIPTSSAPTPPRLIERFVAFAKMPLAGFGGAPRSMSGTG